MTFLPTSKVKPRTTNPGILIVYSLPKTGKTYLFSKLENCLIMDTEGGSNMYESMKVNIIGLRSPGFGVLDKEMGIQPESKEVKAARHERGDYYLDEVLKEAIGLKREGKSPYKFGALDTITRFEDLVIAEATANYMNLPIGKGFNRYTQKDAIMSGNTVEEGTIKPKRDWDSVLTLPQGGGYYHMWEAWKVWINALKASFDHVILSGHLKDKYITREGGKEVATKDIDLTGKLRSITFSVVDAIGYLYKEDKNLYLSFITSEEQVCGSRAAHLADKNVLIAKWGEKPFEFEELNWDAIYRPE